MVDSRGRYTKEELTEYFKPYISNIKDGKSFSHSLVIACDILKENNIKFRGNDVLSILPTILNTVIEDINPSSSSSTG